MNRKDGEAIADLLAELLVHERKANAEKFAALDRRIVELERRPSLAARGVWSAKASYSEGDAVTDKGALWICTNATTGARPGTSHCWKLAVKRGQVGAEP